MAAEVERASLLGSATNEADRVDDRLRHTLEAAGACPWEWDVVRDQCRWSDAQWVLLGLAPGSCRPSFRAFIETVDDGDRARVADHVAAAIRRGDDLALEWRVKGVVPARWLLCRGRALREGGRRPRRYVGILLDVSERRAAQEAQRIAAERDAFLLGLADALRPLDDPGEVRARATRVIAEHLGACRARFALLDGHDTVATAVEHRAGRPRRELPRHRLEAFGPALLDVLRAGSPCAIEEVASDPRLGPQQRRRLARLGAASLLAQPLLRDGHLVALLVLIHAAPRRFTPGDQALVAEALERTWTAVERVRAQRALLSSEERARRAAEQRQLSLDAARMGWWHLELSSGRLFCDQRCREILGITGGSRLAEELLRMLHPDDAELARALLAEAETAKVGPLTLELRLRRADGALRWVETRAASSLVAEEGQHSTVIVGTACDITERKRWEEELLRADRRKDEFLATLGHELRNPLSAIGHAIHLLRAVPGGSDAALRAQAILDRQTAHLGRLVEELLDVTRIAQGKVVLRRQPLDRRELCVQVAEDQLAALDHAGLRFEVALPQAPCWIDGDATRITQVLANLLHNARKFTPRGGRVELALVPKEGEARVEVRDSGAGLDEALAARLFDPFVQGERTLARADGGLGLGLALVKGISELHGGTVSAQSRGPDQGACFTVRLPLLHPAAESPAASPAAAAPARGTAQRVLIVDDDADAGESLAAVVELFGHRVHLAHDGPSALATVATFEPDVVLCDIHLGGMSGFELAHALRRTAPPTIRLVGVSGDTEASAVQAALRAGFDAYLPKPADPAALERLLASVPAA